MRFLRQSTALDVVVGPLVDKTDGVTPVTAATLGGITAAVIKGDARTGLTLAASGNNHFTHIADGYWELNLTTSDTNTTGIFRVTLRDDDGFLPMWEDFMVLPQQVFDSLVTGTDQLEVDAVRISGSPTAADNVQANIANLDASVASRLAASAVPANFDDLAITPTTGLVSVGTNNDKSGYSISGTKNTFDDLNDISSAGVNAQVDQALADVNLDKLVKNAATLSTDVADGSVIGQMLDDGSATYSRTTDSLQAIRDAGGGGGGGGASAAEIADAVLDEPVSDHQSAGSLGAELRLAKAMLANKRRHTVSTGVDEVFDDDGTTVLRTLTPSDGGDDQIVVDPS